MYGAAAALDLLQELSNHRVATPRHAQDLSTTYRVDLMFTLRFVSRLRNKLLTYSITFNFF